VRSSTFAGIAAPARSETGSAHSTVVVLPFSESDVFFLPKFCDWNGNYLALQGATAGSMNFVAGKAEIDNSAITIAAWRCQPLAAHGQTTPHIDVLGLAASGVPSPQPAANSALSR